MSTKVNIPATVSRLRKTFDSRKTKPLEWRKQQLSQIQKMLEENEAVWREALLKDLGHKTRYFVEIEQGQVVDECKIAISNLDTWTQPEPHSTPVVLQPSQSYIVHEPLGVVLIIAPWNYPVSLLIVPLIGAIAAGNCVILKPSEVAPATSAVAAKLIAKYMDQDAVALIEGAVEETTELLKQRFDYILYTGNGTVGKIVQRAAAEYLTPVTLELGGKSPCIVDKTANFDVAAKRILWGKFLNCGQTCVAPDYLLVEKSAEKEFLETLKKYLAQFYGEDPQKSPDYSRIVNKRHWARLNNIFERAKGEGIEVVVGGKVDEQDQYIAPTIVRNVKTSSALLEDELFGPFLPILTWENFSEAVDIIHSWDKPLAAYLFSNNNGNHKTFLEDISSGGGCINDTVIHVINPDLPFGGVGPSGMGAYHGINSFRIFSHHKAIMQRGAALDLDVRYPPYSDAKLDRLALLRKISIPKRALAGVGAVGLVALVFGLVKTPAVKEFIVRGLKSALNLLEKV